MELQIASSTFASLKSGEYHSFSGENAGIFLTSSVSTSIVLLLSGEWPCHGPPNRTPTMCRPVVGQYSRLHCVDLEKPCVRSYAHCHWQAKQPTTDCSKFRGSSNVPWRKPAFRSSSGLVPSTVFKKNLWAFLGPCVRGRGRPWYGTSAQPESHFTCSSPRGAPRVVPN